MDPTVCAAAQLFWSSKQEAKSLQLNLGQTFWSQQADRQADMRVTYFQSLSQAVQLVVTALQWHPLAATAKDNINNNDF